MTSPTSGATLDADPATAKEAIRERFAALLRRNQAALSRLAASHTRTSSDRDDLLQEIAMALWLALPRFRGECAERTFLFRIAHNRCISHVVRRRDLASLEDVDGEVADPGPGIEARLSEAEQSQRLLDAIRQLPLTYRQVVVLALEDLDYREMAEVLGISDSNVGVRLNRARALLRERLGETP
jgi:RNA polymerase sigma factor (sigma-70 family)